MEEENTQNVEEAGAKETKPLYFKKRVRELNQRYLEGDDLLAMQDYINKHIYFYRTFEPAFYVKAGEIYYADFPVGFGSEIQGKHPVVVLNSSYPNNPLMTIVPLTSGRANQCNDVVLGKIQGLSKENEDSVAVINQMRSIDKRRLVLDKVIEVLQAREQENPTKANGTVRVDTLKICRLSEEQLRKLKVSVKKYIDYNIVHKRKKKLVVF